MRVVSHAAELETRPRVVALGTFDGVHRGHRRVIEEALAVGDGLRPTVVTFDPHPRTALGNRVELLTTLTRRLELLAAVGIDDVLVIEFTLELARLSPEDFVERFLRPIGTELVVAGADFRFGAGRRGDLALLQRLDVAVRPVSLVDGVSSTAVRRHLREGEMAAAAALLGRPPEIEGVVVAGDARGGTLGYPTANLVPEPELLVPAYGIYAGRALDHPAAVSIGTNPHYGGDERRIEAFLLDFEGDLYGSRLVVELWRRLREERVFGSEAELVEQIGRDVAETRSATSPI